MYNSILKKLRINEGKFWMPGATSVDDSYPAAAYQDSIVGRMKNQGKFGNSDSMSNPAAISADAQNFADVTQNASGTVQNTIYPLNSILIPANAFIKNARGLRLRFWGITAANANAKDFIYNIGAVATTIVTGSTASAKAYFGTLDLVRISALLASCVFTLQIDTATSPALIVNAAVALVESGAILINLSSRNTAAAAASATGQGMSGIFLN